MKSTLILSVSFLLLAISVTVLAQSKPVDTVKKTIEAPKLQAYKKDPNKVIQITIQGREEQLGGLSFVISNGIPIVDSTDYPAKQRNAVKAYSAAALTKIEADIKEFWDADRVKWEADKAKFKADSTKAASLKKPK